MPISSRWSRSSIASSMLDLRTRERHRRVLYRGIVAISFTKPSLASRCSSGHGFACNPWAHRADINRGYISTLENCEAYVGLEILGRLADVLEVEGAGC
jgi:hypothetical protein